MGRIKEVAAQPAPLQARVKVWLVVYMAIVHLAALAGLVLLLQEERFWASLGLCVFVYWLTGLGVTAGAHRLWAHRSYKAAPALRFFSDAMQFHGQPGLHLPLGA